MTKRSGTTAIVNPRFSRKYSSYHFLRKWRSEVLGNFAKNRAIQSPRAYQPVDGTPAESATVHPSRHYGATEFELASSVQANGFSKRQPIEVNRPYFQNPAPYCVDCSYLLTPSPNNG
jgi:hypothetical protein